MDETPITCRGCGACCERVGYPPFWSLAGNRDPSFDALERSLPELAADVCRAATTGRCEQNQPCIWLDPITQCCRHYDHRPRICRDFELGSPKCRELRWLKGIG